MKPSMGMCAPTGNPSSCTNTSLLSSHIHLIPSFAATVIIQGTFNWILCLLQHSSFICQQNPALEGPLDAFQIANWAPSATHQKHQEHRQDMYGSQHGDVSIYCPKATPAAMRNMPRLEIHRYAANTSHHMLHHITLYRIILHVQELYSRYLSMVVWQDSLEMISTALQRSEHFCMICMTY